MTTTPYFSSQRIGNTLTGAFKGIMRAPSEYFTAMPPAYNYRDSFILLLIYLSIPALMVSLFTNLINILLILPLSLFFGIIGTWLWACYLGWAARKFCASTLSTAGAFQICAYSTAPLVLSWIPIFGPIACLWNLYLNWQGMISHARLGGGSALLIIIGAFVISGLSFVALLFALIYSNLNFEIHSFPTLPAPTWL
ncbi:MAG: YIP1 family protein [Mariprofundaceae bacterium]